MTTARREAQTCELCHLKIKIGTEKSDGRAVEQLGGLGYNLHPLCAEKVAAMPLDVAASYLDPSWKEARKKKTRPDTYATLSAARDAGESLPAILVNLAMVLETETARWGRDSPRTSKRLERAASAIRRLATTKAVQEADL